MCWYYNYNKPLMKPRGSKIEYEKERAKDLMRVYHDLIESADFIRLPDIYKELVNRPSTRFWVSEERATIVISAMARGCKLYNMRPTKREMYKEIYRRVTQLKRTQPHLTIYELVFKVIRQRAPKFYMTPGYAKSIITATKKQWYEERRRKLRHLF